MDNKTPMHSPEMDFDDNLVQEVIYSIIDNGAGFDMRYENNLFGVFTRLHSDKNDEQPGYVLAFD